MYDNDLHDEEEQPVTFHQRVYRLGRTIKQANRTTVYNTDEGSDSDETVLPHRTSGTMTWRQQTGATNARIYAGYGDTLTDSIKRRTWKWTKNYYFLIS